MLLFYVLVSTRRNLAAQTVVLSGGVVLPLERTKVGKVIRATFGYWSDVVNFPSILVISVTIEAPTNPSTALVFAPYRRVASTDNLRFLPDSKFSFFTKICHMSKISCWLVTLHP